MSIKGQGHYLTWAQGHSDYNIIIIIIIILIFETKFQMNAFGYMEMQFNSIHFSHMTKVAAMPKVNTP